MKENKEKNSNNESKAKRRQKRKEKKERTENGIKMEKNNKEAITIWEVCISKKREWTSHNSKEGRKERKVEKYIFTQPLHHEKNVTQSQLLSWKIEK